MAKKDRAGSTSGVVVDDPTGSWTQRSSRESVQLPDTPSDSLFEERGIFRDQTVLLSTEDVPDVSELLDDDGVFDSDVDGDDIDLQSVDIEGFIGDDDLVLDEDDLVASGAFRVDGKGRTPRPVPQSYKRGAAPDPSARSKNLASAAAKPLKAKDAAAVARRGEEDRTSPREGLDDARRLPLPELPNRSELQRVGKGYSDDPTQFVQVKKDDSPRALKAPGKATPRTEAPAKAPAPASTKALGERASTPPSPVKPAAASAPAKVAAPPPAAAKAPPPKRADPAKGPTEGLKPAAAAAQPAPTHPKSVGTSPFGKSAVPPAKAAAPPAKAAAPPAKVAPAPIKAAPAPAAPAKAAPAPTKAAESAKAAAPAGKPPPASAKASAAKLPRAETTEDQQIDLGAQNWALRANRLLGDWLPDFVGLELLRAHMVNDRASQIPLWTKHRAGFSSRKDLARAMAASAVLDALQRVPQGKLVALEARDAGRYSLIWIDLDREQLVTVLTDLKAS